MFRKVQPNVLFLTVDDFANATAEFVRSLQSTGVIAAGLKFVEHPFTYRNTLRVIEHDLEIFGAVNNATHIVYCQSTRMTRDCIPRDRRSKQLFLFIGDQLYRNYPDRVLAYYPRLDKVFYQGSDLKGKSKYPEEWLLPAIDTEFVQTQDPPENMSGKIRIAHYPRNYSDKGSAVILKVMNELQQSSEFKDRFIFDYSDEWIYDWEQNIRRLDTCDVYIESQAYTIKSGAEERPCCEFGVTAMEAASLSKAVITCFKSFNDYEAEWGAPSAIIPSNSEEELRTQLQKVLSMSREELIQHRINTRTWVCQNHSHEATGRRLIKLLDL